MIKSIKKNSKIICYVLAFIIPVLFMFIISSSLQLSPFGNRSPLVADTRVQFEIYITYLKTVVFGNNDMFYTFSKTLGGDMAGFSFYYLGNPFIYLLVFLPDSLVPAGVLLVIILIMGLSSLNFNIMLNNIYGFRWSSLLFSVSYAFIGYFMSYYNFIIYFNNIMLVPIIILGLYEITVKNKISVKYTLFLAASIITNYYIGYMTCIFCFIFFIYLLVTNKNEINIKKHVGTVWRFVWQSLLSVVISAVALFTVAFSLMNGQKIDDGFGLKIARGLNFNMRDLFSGFYSISFNGNISDGLPVIYCGVLPVIFLFLYFFNKEVKIKEKIASGSVILILILSFYIKFINRIWHGMSETVGFPYRYSFFLSFFILLISYKAFILMKQGTRKFHTLIIFGVFVIYSLYLLISNNDYVGTLQIILTGAFLCMYLAGIYAICYKREYMYPVTIGFFLIMSFDLLLNGYHSIKQYYMYMSEEESSMDHYMEYFNTLDEIHKKTDMDNSDNGFYRMDKLFRENMNDAMLVGYNGLSHFSSTESTDVIEFMRDLGYCTTDMWAYYGEEGNTSFTDALLSVKYMATQFDETAKPYDYLDKVNEKYIFKNPYALPLIFGTKGNIEELDREKYNHFTIQNEIAKSITGQTYGIYRPVEVLDVVMENVEKYEKSYTKIDADKEAYIEYRLNVTSNDFIYMYFTAPSKQATRIYVNDMLKPSYFTTYGWSIKCAGYFDENTVIPVRVYLDQDEIEIDGYEFYYESKDELNRWYNDTISTDVKVNADSSSHLIASANVDNDCNRLVCSMPYDKGWTVKVDGEEVQTEPVMGVLMSFEIEPGIHEIEMRYIPRGFIAGLIISICGLMAITVIHIIERIRIKKLLKND